jgi:hypothetical protein
LAGSQQSEVRFKSFLSGHGLGDLLPERAVGRRNFLPSLGKPLYGGEGKSEANSVKAIVALQIQQVLLAVSTKLKGPREIFSGEFVPEEV